jgi:hypothetical protein
VGRGYHHITGKIDIAPLEPPAIGDECKNVLTTAFDPQRSSAFAKLFIRYRFLAVAMRTGYRTCLCVIVNENVNSFGHA